MLMMSLAAVSGARFFAFEKLWGLSKMIEAHKFVCSAYTFRCTAKMFQSSIAILVMAASHIALTMVASHKTSSLVEALLWWVDTTGYLPIVFGRYALSALHVCVFDVVARSITTVVATVIAALRQFGNRQGLIPRFIWKSVHLLFYPTLAVLVYHGYGLTYSPWEAAVSIFCGAFPALALLLRFATILRDLYTGVWRVEGLLARIRAIWLHPT